MDRRKFIIGSATGLTAAASATLVLTKGFDPSDPVCKQPERLQSDGTGKETNAWKYHELDLNSTADIAYRMYPDGGCMYALFGSLITQLAEKFGEPYSSFPYSMMRYGASGIGEYGSVCGALNGAAAIVGLFVKDKSHMNAIIEDFFTWYEKATLPIYTPKEPKYTIVTSVSNSVLCHASTANWIKASGHRIDSKERSDRCSRLTADVAQKVVGLLNNYFSTGYTTSNSMDIETQTCVQCHSQTGKLGNIRGNMECASCHEPSLAHTLFADIHYKLMD